MNYIFGTGGFAKEVSWCLVENKKRKITFVDVEETDRTINGFPVISEKTFLEINNQKNKKCFIAVGSPNVRYKIYEKIKNLPNICFPNLIDNKVKINKQFNLLGFGNIICRGVVVTTNITIGNFNHFNLNTTIGHDVEIKNFCTFSPGSNISGCTKIGNMCFFGTNSVLLENLKIIDSTTIGAGAVVTKDLVEPGVYVGIPAKLRR